MCLSWREDDESKAQMLFKPSFTTTTILFRPFRPKYKVSTSHLQIKVTVQHRDKIRDCKYKVLGLATFDRFENDQHGSYTSPRKWTSGKLKQKIKIKSE